MTPNKIQIAVVLVTTFLSMCTDLKYGKILNKITFPAMLIGLVLSVFFNGFSGSLQCLGAMFGGIAVYLPLALLGIVGMGDAKLMGAVGAICGPGYTLSVFLYTSALGLIHAVIVQILNYGSKSLSVTSISIFHGLFLKKTIQQENLENKDKHHYKFLIGIDIFLGAIIAAFYSFSL